MLYYYARIMFQRMRNRKLTGIINVGGLAFSLAAVILIARWVQNEADKNWQIFALASIIGMLAALVTLGMQAVRAARSNPVQSQE